MAKRITDRPIAEPQPGQPVEELVPSRPTLRTVREISRGCKACDLYKRGTQTLFGEGPSKAEIMLVGVESALAPLVSATVHPSSILRAPDDDSRREEIRAFVADLRKIARNLSPVRPE